MPLTLTVPLEVLQIVDQCTMLPFMPLFTSHGAVSPGGVGGLRALGGSRLSVAMQAVLINSTVPSGRGRTPSDRGFHAGQGVGTANSHFPALTCSSAFAVSVAATRWQQCRLLWRQPLRLSCAFPVPRISLCEMTLDLTDEKAAQLMLLRQTVERSPESLRLRARRTQKLGKNCRTEPNPVERWQDPQKFR